MDILQIIQLRLDKCATKQFWAVALLASMNGFLFTKIDPLISAIGAHILKLGVVVASIFGTGYIISRFIYLRYDLIANEIMAQKAGRVALLLPPSDGLMKTAAQYSGVVFYGIIVIAMAIVSWLVIGRPKKAESKKTPVLRSTWSGDKCRFIGRRPIRRSSI